LNSLHILAQPPFKMTAFFSALELVRTHHLAHYFHFVVESEDDVAAVEKLVTKHDLINIELHPYYNGKNLDFFEDNVFITKESVKEFSPTIKRIFSNMSINALDFKRLTVLNNKDVYANVNKPRLGKLGSRHIMEFVKEEMTGRQSWGLVRKFVSPCKSCPYNSLCPPISNYEHVLKRYNLCHIWQKP